MKTVMRWTMGLGIGIVILAGCLVGCDRRAGIMPGAYVASGTAGSSTPPSLYIDRENATVWLHLTDGTVVTAAYTARPNPAWPAGCPANLGSTRMEVLDLALDDLRLGSATMQHPILVRNCPPDPVELVLREAGEIDGAGTACAGAETCLSFTWASERDTLPAAMKGYELYSWRDAPDEPWTYTLITGTNRNKTWDEISAPESAVTAEGWVKLTVSGETPLRSVLVRLPQESEVFWIGPEAVPEDTDLGRRIGIPETKTVDALITYGRDHGDLRIHVAPAIARAAITGAATAAEADAVPTGPDEAAAIAPPAHRALIGVMAWTSASARIITLASPVDGIRTIALLADAEILAADGERLTLNDLRPGTHIEARGERDEADALLATEIHVLVGGAEVAPLPN